MITEEDKIDGLTVDELRQKRVAVLLSGGVDSSVVVWAVSYTHLTLPTNSRV